MEHIRLTIRGFGHESRMPQETLSKQTLLATANTKRPVGRPRTRWTITLRILDGTAWDFAQTKWWMWWNTVKRGRLNLELLPSQRSQKGGQWRERDIRLFSTNTGIILYSKSNKMFLKQLKMQIFNGKTKASHKENTKLIEEITSLATYHCNKKTKFWV